MHSYTFSSSHPLRAWLITFAGALILLALALWQYQNYWARLGYLPQVQDTRQNWALQRLQASLAGKRALVFAGASRTLYGIDLSEARQQLPNHHPVMLAVNGHYSFALLENLAKDRLFRGVLILDIDARGLARNNHATLRPYLDVYEREFSPSKAVHQHFVRYLQNDLLFMDHKFGWVEVSKHWLNGTLPAAPNNTRIDLQRNALLDLAAADGVGLAAWFGEAVESDMQTNPPAAPAQWLADLAQVPGWVAAIRKRGGEVIFYVPPVSGMQAELARRYFPRETYWNAFIATYGLKGLDAEDVAGMQQFELPDESHIDYRDKSAYTRELLQVLQEKGWLAKER